MSQKTMSDKSKNAVLNLGEVRALLGYFISSGFSEIIGEETIDSNITCLSIDSSRIMINFGSVLPCFVIKNRIELDSEIDECFLKIIDYSISMQFEKNPILLIGSSDNNKWVELCKNSQLLITYVPINMLYEIGKSSSPFGKLIQYMKTFRGLLHLVPYRHTGYVTGSIFVGREKEINLITTSYDNFALYGHRQSGKTSLMLRVKEEMHKMGFESEYFDFYNFRNYGDLFDKITLKFAPLRARRTTIDNFDWALKTIGKAYKGKVLLCLDEIDALINYDSNNSYILLRILHDACNNRWCRVVIAGYRELFDHIVHHDTSLHALLKPIQISVLDDKSARKLITSPLANLGIAIPSDEVINHILKTTGNHPAFIQFYCELITKILDVSGMSKLSNDILTKVEADPSFVQFVLEKVLMNTIDEERLILFTLMHDVLKYDSFIGVPVLHQSLRSLGWNIGMNELDKHLFHLDKINLLSRVGDQVKFSIPAFPKILSSYLDLKYRVKELLRAVVS
jgi:Novel STAND NTPase 1